MNSHQPPLPRALDGALTPWQNRADYGATVPLFETGNHVNFGPGLDLRLDPNAQASGHWSSPEGRLLELRTRVDVPGAWFGLHVALPDDALDLTGVSWIGVTARTSALQAVSIRVGLRSGQDDGGFQDSFFARHILSQARQSDHHEVLCPAHLPDLPRQAPWRELVLFLPPATAMDWVLHDLRVFAL